mmetsp:Transcript_153792/g.493143  ORF Transcript_153792/g.493143 Transcript_153792/m.493143 type:complete len:216 (+) Transcript_153792:495-1142(+)
MLERPPTTLPRSRTKTDCRMLTLSVSVASVCTSRYDSNCVSESSSSPENPTRIWVPKSFVAPRWSSVEPSSLSQIWKIKLLCSSMSLYSTDQSQRGSEHFSTMCVDLLEFERSSISTVQYGFGRRPPEVEPLPPICKFRAPTTKTLMTLHFELPSRPQANDTCATFFMSPANLTFFCSSCSIFTALRKLASQGGDLRFSLLQGSGGSRSFSPMLS